MDISASILEALTRLLGATGANVAQSAAFSTGLLFCLFIVGWIFRVLVKRMELREGLQLSNYEAGTQIRLELRQEIEALRKQLEETKTRLVDCQRRFLSERNFNRRLLGEVARLKSARGKK